MIGLYFSGTGNTKHCVTKFVKSCDEANEAVAIESADTIEKMSGHELIVFGYPVHFSNAPKYVRDFIAGNGAYFKNKKVFIIATMGLFSGDGAGCSARIFKKHGAEIVGGLHLKMPDCIGDVKLLKKSLSDNIAIIEDADKKIYDSVKRLREGNPSRDGLNIICHLAGLFGQRLWYYSKTASYKSKPDVDTQKCSGCGRCAELCPLGNIEIINEKAAQKGKCTMCYRCFSSCPNQALTILGEQVIEQCCFEKYM